MHELAEAVQQDPIKLTPAIQEEWARWEAQLIRESGADPMDAVSLLEQRTQRLLETRKHLLATIPTPTAARV